MNKMTSTTKDCLWRVLKEIVKIHNSYSTDSLYSTTIHWYQDWPRIFFLNLTWIVSDDIAQPFQGHFNPCKSLWLIHIGCGLGLLLQHHQGMKVLEREAQYGWQINWQKYRHGCSLIMHNRDGKCNMKKMLY